MQLFLRHQKPAQWPQSIRLEIGGGTLDIAVRVHARARTYRLRLTDAGRAVLTVPPFGRVADAEDFVRRQQVWLETRLKRIKGPQPFVAGALVPLRGIEHVIIATGRLRGTVATGKEAGRPALFVPGSPDHLSRRLTDWLKSEAKRDLDARVDAHAARLGVRPTGLSLRSQSSRWGSCSVKGRLNFNWRLILAPPFVLDYVAAHEVAHMCEMNHSPAFWARVEETLPDYMKGRAWLRAHGRELMVLGLSAE